LAGSKQVPKDVWDSGCICPGASKVRARFDEHERERVEYKRVMREVIAEIDTSPGRTEAELRADIAAECVKRGLGFTDHSIELAAGMLSAKGKPAPVATAKALHAVGRWVGRLVDDVRKDHI
jgi:hypothetical protein